MSNKEINKGGRPEKFSDEKALKEAVEDYFENHAYIEQGGDRVYAPTVTGLAYHLGICRDTLNRYSKDDRFSDTLKKAKQRVGIALEQRLFGNNVTGVIFNLKNNFGWKDKSEQEITSDNRHEHTHTVIEFNPVDEED